MNLNILVEDIMQKGLSSLDLSGLEENKRRDLLIGIGSKFKDQGKYHVAIDIFHMVGYKKGLINIGDIMQDQNLWFSLGAYSLAKYNLGIIRIGDKFLAQGNLSDALKAYEKAESKEAFIKMGNIHIDFGRLSNAIEFYKKGGKELSLEQIMRVGEICLNKRYYIEAIEAFKMAGSTIGLNKVGDKCFKNERFDDAIEAYKIAGNIQALLDIVKICIDKNFYFLEAVLVCKDFGIDLPREDIISKGDEYFKKKSFIDALDYYKAVNYVEGIINIGNAYLDKEDLSKAIECFEEVESSEGLIKVGDKAFKNGNLLRAKYAFKKAKREDLLNFLGYKEQNLERKK